LETQPHIRIKENLMFLSSTGWGMIDKIYEGVQCIQDMDVLCTFCFDKRSINAIVVYACVAHHLKCDVVWKSP